MTAAAALAGCSRGLGAKAEESGVPPEYRDAVSIGGQHRSPEGVHDKSAVEYQPEPKDGQRCANCALYIKDKNGDGMGACSIVAGKIDPDAWCIDYVPYEE